MYTNNNRVIRIHSNNVTYTLRHEYQVFGLFINYVTVSMPRDVTDPSALLCSDVTILG